MSHERFRITGVRVGSAARSAEDAAPIQPLGRVRAGSAAKLAEDAKQSDRLNGGTLGSSATGFRLRAQGGRPFRPEDVHPPMPTKAAPEPTRSGEPDVPVAAASVERFPAGSQGVAASSTGSPSTVRAVPSQTTAGRLKTFFRALFPPGGLSPNQS